MKRILTNDDLEIGEYYWCKYRGKIADLWTIEQVQQTHNMKYIGSHIWATDDNSQALEKYIIIGPIPQPKIEEFS